MSTQKISAGLAAYDGPTGRNLSSFKTGINSLSQLVEAAHAIDSKHGAFAKRICMLANDVEGFAAQERERWAGVSDLPKAQREALAAKEAKKFRRDIAGRTEKERYDLLRDLREASKRIESMSALFETASHILAREGLGSEERSRYLSQIAHSGPVELKNLAALAVNTNNRVLGAAVLSRLDSMPPDVRKDVGVSRQELAECLCGAEFAKAQEAITIARNRISESINLNRDFESGRRFNGHARISEALAKQEESGVLAEGETENE